MCCLFLFIAAFCVWRIRSLRSADVQVLSAIVNYANGLSGRIQRTHRERAPNGETIYKSSSVAAYAQLFWNVRIVKT